MALFIAFQAAAQNSVDRAAEQSGAVHSVALTGHATMDAYPVPPSQLTLEQTGDSLLVSGHYQAAILSYERIVQPSAIVWNRMGLVYQMLYDLKNAVRCYKESLKLQPENFKVLNNLAITQEIQHDLPAAEHNFREALRLEPGSAKVLSNLGTNLLMQQKYAKSAEAYKQALAVDPSIFDNPPDLEVLDPSSIKAVGKGNYLKAQSCARAGLTDCAIAYLQRAFDEGSASVKKVEADKDFANLRDTPALARLLAQER